MIIFIILNLIDCLTTFIGLQNEYIIEGNLLYSYLFSNSIWLGLGVKMLLALIIALLVKKYKQKLFKPLNIAFTIVVTLNIITITLNSFIL